MIVIRYVLLVTLSALITVISACNGAATIPKEMPPSPPPLSTAVPALTLTESPHSIVESPAVEATATIIPAVSAPAGLLVVYLREGNLWSWTEDEGNELLTGTGDLTSIRLSGDGQSLAFMRGHEVWTIRMDGTGSRPLVTEPTPGGALSFSPDGTYLAVSTADHVDLIDLRSGASSMVVNYAALSDDKFPEVTWLVDSTGFKTVIPPNSDTDQARFLFVFTSGETASLAQFKMLTVSGSRPFISPDGGYIIFAAQQGDGKEALYLMDSSGAAKTTGEPADRIRALGWLPDSKHFTYEWKGGERTLLLVGQIMGEPPVEVDIKPYETLRWVDAERFLGLQDGNLYLGDIDGGEMLIADSVSDFDFGH